ncbi:MAG: hypothetical protein JWM74_1605, partial [Myxococcaceae bacterium]|nr:hypothetical protein [Myxococcaceae bacterium]
VDAQREVRLYTMRAGAAAPGKPKSRSVPDAQEAKPSKSGSPKPPPTTPTEAAKGFLNRLFKK